MHANFCLLPSCLLLAPEVTTYIAINQKQTIQLQEITLFVSKTKKSPESHKYCVVVAFRNITDNCSKRWREVIPPPFPQKGQKYFKGGKKLARSVSMCRCLMHSGRQRRMNGSGRNVTEQSALLQKKSASFFWANVKRVNDSQTVKCSFFYLYKI